MSRTLLIGLVALTLGAGGAKAGDAKQKADPEKTLSYERELRRAGQLAEADNVPELTRILEKWQPGPGQHDYRQWEWFYLQALGRRLTLSAQADDKAIGYFTLFGHQQAIVRLAWSADGSRVLSYDAGGNVKAWELAARKELFSFQVPADAWLGYRGDRWSPDGKRVAVVRDGGLVEIIDSATGKTVASIPRYEGAFYRAMNNKAGCRAVAWSPDGKEIAVNGPDKEVRVFAASTGKQTRAFAGHEAAVLDVAWSADGKQLASAGADATARVWNVTTGKETARYLVPEKTDLPQTRVVVALVSWRPGDKQLLISAGTIYEKTGFFSSPLGPRPVTKGMTRLWDVANDKEIGHWYPRLYHPDLVRWSPDGKLMQFIAGESQVSVHDVDSDDRLVYRGGGKMGGYPYTVFTSDPGLRQAAIVGDYGRLVTLVRLPSGEAFRSVSPWLAPSSNMLPKHEITTRIGWSPDGQTLALGSSQGKIHISPVNLKAPAPSEFLGSVYDAPIWSPDGSRYVVNRNTSAGMQLCRLPLGQPFTRLGDAPGNSGYYAPEPKHLNLSPDGRRLALVSDGVKIWDTASAKLISALPGHKKYGGSGLDGLAWSGKGKYLATWAHDGPTIKFWEPETGKELLHFDGGVGFVGWGPTENIAVLGFGDKLFYWDLVKGAKTQTVSGSNAGNLIWSPDGGLVAGVAFKGGRQTLTVWTPDLSKRVTEFDARFGTSFALSFSPDTRYLVCVTSHDGGFVYDLKLNEKAALNFESVASAPSGIAWSPDGKQFAFAVFQKVYLFDTQGKSKGTKADASSATLAWGDQGLLRAGVIRAGDDPFAPRVVQIRNLTTDKTQNFPGPPADDPFKVGGRFDVQTRRLLAWSFDGKQLAVAGEVRQGSTIHSEVRVFDGDSGKVRHTLKLAFEPASLTWSPDGKRVAILGGHGPKTRIHLWEVNQKNVVEVEVPPVEQFPRIPYLAWSPTGKHLAIAQYTDRKPSIIRVLDTQTWKEARVFQGSAAWQILAWSPDGKFLAAGGDPIHLWDVAAGKEVQKITGNLSEVDEILWAGSRIVVRSRQSQGQPEGRALHEVRVFDAVGGHEVIAVRGLAAEINFNLNLSALARRVYGGMIVSDVAASRDTGK